MTRRRSSEPVIYEFQVLSETGESLFKASTEVIAGARRPWEFTLPPLNQIVEIRISTRMAKGKLAAHAWAWIAGPKLIQQVTSTWSGKTGNGAGRRPLDYSPDGRYAATDKDNVCLCIVMNHPHPENIEKLDRMYGDRFAKIFYLVPFYRSEDPRVITIYRGSYTHNAYITDAYDRLAQEDVSHYVVCQDDVLLNPRLNGRNLVNVFDLGPDEGFIDGFFPFPQLDKLNDWHWGLGVILKSLYPRSAFWGSGVDFENLFRFLPPRQAMLDIMARHGFTPERMSSLGDKDIETFARGVSPDCLFGGLKDQDPDRCARNTGIIGDLFTSAFEYAGTANALDLRYTFAMCGPQADFYIIPKTGLARYAHISGVLGANQIFAEVATPTALLLSADHVRTTADVGVNMSFYLQADGYGEPEALAKLFESPNFLGAHPVKLSKFSNNYMRLVEIPEA